jgi:hypothetical protein
MADEADVSQDRMEAEEARRRALAQPVGIPKGTGECLYCTAKLDDDRRWCDSECRADFERLKLRKQ